MSQSDLRHFISSRNVFARVLVDDAFTMVCDGRGAVRQDGNEVAHEADKDLVRDAVIHADPGDLRRSRTFMGVFLMRTCRNCGYELSWCQPTVYFYSCGMSRTFMYITVKSLESDPDSSNLDCSTKAINIILRRVRNYL